MKNCLYCSNIFNQKQCNQLYCSVKCKRLQYTKDKKWQTYEQKMSKKPKINQCKKCGEITANLLFCSWNCASFHTNSIKKTCKKTYKKTYYCKGCKNILRIGWQSGSSYCENCRLNSEIYTNFVDWNNITIQEFRDKLNNTCQFHARIRSLARSLCKKTNCIICGYSNHVNICHIKPIKDFNKSATIAEVNNPNNLICLCPNHHWELDHGLIKLEEIKISTDTEQKLIL